MGILLKDYRLIIPFAWRRKKQSYYAGTMVFWPGMTKHGVSCEKYLKYQSKQTKEPMPVVVVVVVVMKAEISNIHQIFSLAYDWSKRVTWANIPQLKLGNPQSAVRKKMVTRAEVWVNRPNLREVM